MTAERSVTFAEHIQELRRRLMWSLLFVALGAGLGYLLNDTILALLQRPLNDTLYYTTPGGAFSFIIKLCVAFGFVVSLPMVIYQTFGFFGPLLPGRTKRFLVGFVALSVVLAAAGITFAYLVSLPAALHFLVNFGSDRGNIQALITADEYFNFVLTYIAGFAALFQLPLVILFINKVTPLPPRRLLGATRYVVLGSFIVSAVITPTPDPFNQILMAGPVILLFLVSAGLVMVLNRLAARRRVQPLEPLHIPEAVFQAAAAVSSSPTPPVKPKPVFAAEVPIAPPRQAPRMVSDMIVPRRPVSATYQRRPVMPTSPPARLRPRVTPRLISDFVPATK